MCVCVSSHCREAFSWKRAHQWWRVYWLVGQAPSISTGLKGDSSRPSYWHAELICSFWSIPANWNYHCPASHVSGPFVWLILVLSALACLWRKNGSFISVWQQGETCLPFCGQKWRCFSVETFSLCSINHNLITAGAVIRSHNKWLSASINLQVNLIGIFAVCLAMTCPVADCVLGFSAGQTWRTLVRSPSLAPHQLNMPWTRTRPSCKFTTSRWDITIQQMKTEKYDGSRNQSL